MIWTLVAVLGIVVVAALVWEKIEARKEIARWREAPPGPFTRCGTPYIKMGKQPKRPSGV